MNWILKPKDVVDVTEDDKSEVLRALEEDELRDRVEDVEIHNASAQVGDGLKANDGVPDRLSMDLKFSEGNSVHSRLQNFDKYLTFLKSVEPHSEKVLQVEIDLWKAMDDEMINQSLTPMC